MGCLGGDSPFRQGTLASGGPLAPRCLSKTCTRASELLCRRPARAGGPGRRRWVWGEPEVTGDGPQRRAPAAAPCHRSSATAAQAGRPPLGRSVARARTASGGRTLETALHRLTMRTAGPRAPGGPLGKAAWQCARGTLLRAACKGRGRRCRSSSFTKRRGGGRARAGGSSWHPVPLPPRLRPPQASKRRGHEASGLPCQTWAHVVLMRKAGEIRQFGRHRPCRMGKPDVQVASHARQQQRGGGRLRSTPCNKAHSCGMWTSPRQRPSGTHLQCRSKRA